MQGWEKVRCRLGWLNFSAVMFFFALVPNTKNVKESTAIVPKSKEEDRRKKPAKIGGENLIIRPYIVGKLWKLFSTRSCSLSLHMIAMLSGSSIECTICVRGCTYIFSYGKGKSQRLRVPQKQGCQLSTVAVVVHDIVQSGIISENFPHTKKKTFPLSLTSLCCWVSSTPNS